MGEFAAVVKMKSSKIRIGFGDSGTFSSGSKIEMEGTVLECECGGLPTSLLRGRKTLATVSIEFAEQPDWVGNVDVYTDDGDGYLGMLQLWVNDEALVRAHVSLLLPAGALHLLVPWMAYSCRLETINEPNDARKLDNVIAFVKRIYLEPVIAR